MDRFEETCFDYLAGAMSEAERAAFLREVEADPVLRAELAEQERLHGMLEHAEAGSMPAAVARSIRRQTQTQRRSFMNPIRILGLTATLAAAAVLLVVVMRPPDHQAAMNTRIADGSHTRMSAEASGHANGKPDVIAAPISPRPCMEADELARVDAIHVCAAPRELGFVVSESEDNEELMSAKSPELDGNAEAYDSRFHDDPGSEGYTAFIENEFCSAMQRPLSTFSIDVDTASYANIRRMLNEGRLPPVDAVRVEEMINYFHYTYPEPAPDQPFTVTTELANCPWESRHRLLLVGLQGRHVSRQNLPNLNLVFLIDTSGSMNDDNKLPLVKQSMSLLVSQLGAWDRVSIVTYAGSAGLVLPPTTGDNKQAIEEALARLSSGGSTAGGQGIALAYDVARQHFDSEGVNRVILCTDGDFNVGVSDVGGLSKLVEEKRKTGVFFTALGFGMGNYQDDTMQALAQNGNGTSAYIDTVDEARKVFVEELGASMMTIAKDVKLQLEFNPAKVASYRLIGYETRALRDEDFNNDAKDAGEIGAGHSVTALYEIIPAGAEAPVMTENGADVTPEVDPLKYRTAGDLSPAAQSNELMTVKLRYKEPTAERSQYLEEIVRDEPRNVTASTNLEFASSVALFGMLLRQSKFAGQGNVDLALELAKSAGGQDPNGYRKEYISLVEKAKALGLK